MLHIIFPNPGDVGGPPPDADGERRGEDSSQPSSFSCSAQVNFHNRVKRDPLLLGRSLVLVALTFKVSEFVSE